MVLSREEQPICFHLSHWKYRQQKTQSLPIGHPFHKWDPVLWLSTTSRTSKSKPPAVYNFLFFLPMVKKYF